MIGRRGLVPRSVPVGFVMPFSIHIPAWARMLMHKGPADLLIFEKISELRSMI